MHGDDSSPPPPNLADLCREAVAQFGDDWERIEAYIVDVIGSMSAAERAKLGSEVAATLSFVPPHPETGTHH